MAYYQQNQKILEFNSGSTDVMHIDLNSCFASVEQQANPLLRGKPVAVAAYASANGCILAASYDAKALGVETGMRVRAAQKLCPTIIVLPPDPPKYRSVHLSLRKLLSDYTNDFHAKSIDEFVLNLSGYPLLGKKSMEEIGSEIKSRIKKEIGDALLVSIGISTNRFLAKLASNLQKPDGLSVITKSNFEDIFKRLPVTFLCGIKKRNAKRLSRMGISTVFDFYAADLWQLRGAFHSITSYYWYLRLRGWEIDDTPFGRKSYGNSYSLPIPFSTISELAPIVTKLVTKMSARLRSSEFGAHGVHIGVSYRNGLYWHKGKSFSRILFETSDIYKEIIALLSVSPHAYPVRNVAVSCFELVKKDTLQLELFSDVAVREKLTKAVDAINTRYGVFVLASARMAGTQKYVPDRIAFGNVKELEEFTTQNSS